MPIHFYQKDKVIKKCNISSRVSITYFYKKIQNYKKDKVALLQLA